MKDLVPVMYEKAKEKQATIVICEGWDERVLEAVHNLVKDSICNIVLLGSPDEIKQKCEANSWDLKDTKIVDYKNDTTLQNELAEKLLELRKHKGMTLEQAKELVLDENYFGCLYTYAGHAHGVAGSCIGSTAQLMSPAIKVLRVPGSLVSTTIIMKDPKGDRNLFLTDVSLNPNPTVENLATIAGYGAQAAALFDLEPKVALLSFSTYGSGGQKPELEMVKEATKLAQKNYPNFLFDGELQGDASLNPKAAARKCPDSLLKGEANVLVFPNLMVGNIVCHLLIQLSNCEAIGEVLSGTLKPVSILGRSSTAKMIQDSIACCAMQTK